MKNRDAYIVCRTPGTAADPWHHIYPRGNMPLTAQINGKPQQVELVLDDDAFDKIIAQFREDQTQPNFSGYLVAQEHFAQQPEGSSEAAAWITDLEKRPDGLWGRYGEITDLGEKLIGKRYKFRSPVSDIEHIAGDRWRPINLIDVGLTNKPQFKTLASAKAREGQTQEEDTEVKDQLITLFKIDATADEATIMARVQKAIEAEAQLVLVQTELGTIKAEVLAREADAFVAEHAAHIADPAAVRSQYIAARETTKALFAGLKARTAQAETSTAKARVLSRDTAGVPTAAQMDGGDQTNAAEAKTAARISARAAELKASGACRTLSEAYTKASAEIQTQQ